MRIKTLNGWKFSYPTRRSEWMVHSQRCADGLTGWLETAIDLMMQGMSTGRAKQWWLDTVGYNLDGRKWCRDARDSEPREEGFVVLERVGWILAGAKFREGSQVRPDKWHRREPILTASIFAKQDEEIRFRHLNFH